MSKISYSAMLIGLVITVCSIIRYFFILYSRFQLAAGVALGLIIILLGYIYGWMRKTDEKIQALQRQADALGAIAFNEEKEAVRETAKGEQ